MKQLKEKVDKEDCFARLSKTECNALSKKECENCSFYQHHLAVKGYEKYLPRSFISSKYKNGGKECEKVKDY